MQRIKRIHPISTKLGSQFGIEYGLISSQEEDTSTQITWIFPDGMKDQKGNSLKELR